MAAWIVPLVLSLAQWVEGQTNTTNSILDLKADQTLNTKNILLSTLIPPHGLPPAPTLDVVTKEQAPMFTFAVWEPNGKICLLAKIAATFTISYPSYSGTQTLSVHLPESAKAKGICGTKAQPPALELSWPAFRFSIFFTKLPAEVEPGDTWAATTVELQYDTHTPLFDGAMNPSRKTARSAEGLRLMTTPFGKSYFCPSPSALPLYDSKKDKVVMARLQDVYIQAHAVEKGRFAPLHRCSQVRIGGLPEPFSQNETVAVGSILAVLSVTVVLAYALYRNMTARRMDYDTME